MSKTHPEQGENADYLFSEIDDADFEETIGFVINELIANYSDDESIEKAVTAEDIAGAKSRGLVPQSGDWGKPKRWIRPKDADVPVEEKSELTKLPEDTWKYFDKVPNTILVDIDKLVSSRARPEGIKNANKYMEMSYQGDYNRRKPLDLKDNGDGTYTILDGNSTYANAVHSEWKQLPGVVVETEKPRKKATIRSSKRMTVIGEDVEETLKDIFPEDFKVSDFEDMYSTGLRDFSTEITAIYTTSSPYPRDTSKGISIRIDIHHVEGGKPVQQAGTMDRSFSSVNGKLFVTHQAFNLQKHAQNQGVASDMIENVEKEYEKHGVVEISLSANVDIGGYAWARQGFDFASVKDLKKIRRYFIRKVTELHKNRKISDKDLTSFLEDINSFEYSWEFASWNPKPLPPGQSGVTDKLGKKWMLGRSWSANKRLHKDSPGYQIGKAYFAAKRNTTVKG